MNTIAKLTLSTALTMALASSTASAGIADGWTGDASASGAITSGNTDTTDIGIGINLSKAADVWTHNFDASLDYGEGSDVESKNRTYLGYQIDRQINDRLYGFANTNYFSDEFGAYENGTYLGAGLGYDVLVSEPRVWSVEGGLGYRIQQLRATATETFDEDQELGIRAGSDFDWQLNDAVSCYNDSEVTWAESDTYLWNDIGISAQLAGNFAAKFGVRVDHHTDVPEGFENTDTTTRASLVYTIK